jgi:hypothetical protein
MLTVDKNRIWRDYEKAAPLALEAMERGDALKQPTLRVWRQPGDEHQPVASVEDAALVIDAWSLSDLLATAVAWNAFGLEEYDADAGEWSEWYDDEGRDIDEVMDSRTTG